MGSRRRTDGGATPLIADLPFPRVTIDADTIVDARARPDAARLASSGLVLVGWVGSGVDSVVHRFTSLEGGIVDILGPDGLRSGPITIPPARTLLAPGGTQLLRRAGPIAITVRNGARSLDGLMVPLPSRLAALIGKSAALGLPDGRDRHLLDAIHLTATLRPATSSNRFRRPIDVGCETWWNMSRRTATGRSLKTRSKCWRGRRSHACQRSLVDGRKILRAPTNRLCRLSAICHHFVRERPETSGYQT